MGLPSADPVEAARADIRSRIETIKRLAWDLRDRFCPAELRAHRAVDLAFANGNTPTPELIEAYATAKATLAMHREQLRALARSTESAYDTYISDGLAIGQLTYTRYGLPCGLDTATRQNLWD